MWLQSDVSKILVIVNSVDINNEQWSIDQYV